MLDQATRLREMAAAYRAQASGVKPRRTKAIAVTSGKGGVGKSNISINIAQALVQAGKEVLLMDVDLGMANVDILLGTVPPFHLGHMLQGQCDILELIHRTPSNLKFIAGGSGVAELANLSAEDLKPFLAGLSKLDGQADYLILDTGAGLGDAVVEFVLAADQVIVVTTPEPTSLADAYTTIKALSARNPAIDVKLVVNQVERQEEGAQVAERIMTTAQDFLGIKVEHLGTVPRDPYVWQAVRQKVPFTVAYPGAPASRAVEAMVRQLLYGAPPEPVLKPKVGFFERLTGLFGRRSAG